MDVGTGPGIPGVMLAIARPDLKFTLVDSNGKKIRFIKQVQRTLDLPNLDAIQSRVEELPAQQKFQQIVSRAFTALHQMVKVCHHLLDEGGEFIAMKGTYPEPNQQPLDQQWKIAEAIELYVPFLDEQRHLVVVHRSIGKESLSQEKE